MRQRRLANELDRVRAVPRQFRQLHYKQFKGRAKLVLRRARDGRICEPTRAVREYLDALNEAGGLASGRAQPKMISPTDPASAWTSKAHKRAQFG